MPGRDGTGPMGQGTLTGRGLGLCLGLGLGNGCRRTFGRNFVGQSFLGMTDKEILAEQKSFFQKRLENIEKQLERIMETNK